VGLHETDLGQFFRGQCLEFVIAGGPKAITFEAEVLKPEA
jgi:hypothetical protein